MKPLWIVIPLFIGVGVGEVFPSTAEESSTRLEEHQPSSSTGSTQIESPSDAAPPSTPSEPGQQEPARPKDPLQFESEARRRTIRKDRQEEALRFHQNTLSERFQGADSKGQIFLSFSGDGVDLVLRNITGAEAPVGHLDPPDQPRR